MKQKILLAIALGLAGWPALNGPISRAAEAAESHGLPIGARAPDFKLKDAEAKEHSLSEFQRPGKFVALVFYRSADW